MSKFRSIPYAVLSGSLLFAGAASAQSMYDIDRRQDYQQNRIEQGIESGQITRSEANRLEQGERAIDRAQARARADGVVTPQERARIERMTDRESREIYRQSHDNQQAWDRGQQWGHTDGRNDGWRDRYAGRDGWGNHGGGGDNNWGRHDDPRQSGWNRGDHNGWDGNRSPGVERRDAWADRRIDNGRRDGSLTPGEANRLDRGQNRVDRYEARARSDGTVTPQERSRIDQMQNRESRQIYEARHNDRTVNPTTPPTGPQQSSHNWGNGGWQQRPQTGSNTGTNPTPQSGNNGGWRMHQASAPAPQPTAQPTQQPARTWGNNGGFRMQQANATPATPRPAYTPTSNPTGSSPRGNRR
jgi:hypothetical protein